MSSAELLARLTVGPYHESRAERRGRAVFREGVRMAALRR